MLLFKRQREMETFIIFYDSTRCTTPTYCMLYNKLLTSPSSTMQIRRSLAHASCLMLLRQAGIKQLLHASAAIVKCTVSLSVKQESRWAISGYIGYGTKWSLGAESYGHEGRARATVLANKRSKSIILPWRVYCFKKSHKNIILIINIWLDLIKEQPYA